MHYHELIDLIEQTIPGEAPPLSELKKLAVYKGYQSTLETLKQLIHDHEDKNLLRGALKAFLVTYWNDYKKSPLSYTCIPKHPLTHLCINIAVFISEHTQENPLSLLMPGLNLIPYDEDQPDFPSLDIVPENPTEWLKIIVATHIISDDGLHLIPIKVLRTLSSTPKSHEQLRLPYEFEREDATYLVSSQAYLRLSNHSDYARAVTNAKKHIDIMDQEDNLLSQLRHLIKLLSLYSAHGGIGTQIDAAGAAYNAIVVFHEYYDKLAEEQKNRIPEEVKSEIELLLALSSDAHRNTQATEQIETCIGTRTEKLAYVITPNEHILSQISLSLEEQGTLTIDAINAFDDAKKALEHALAENQYHLANEAIQDSLILTTDLLKKLKIQFTFNSTNDLELFASISPEEITQVLEDIATKNNIIRYFGSYQTYAMRIDQLFILLIHLTPERIIAFLEKMAVGLVQTKILFDKRQLTLILASSLPEKSEAICIGLRKQMPLLIPDLISFSAMLSYLDPAQTLKVCAALNNYLSKLIKTPQDLKVFLNLPLPDQIFDSALTNAKQNTMSLIENMDALRYVLRNIFDEKAVKLITHLAEKIPALIQNANDFRFIFYYFQNKNSPGALLEIGTEIYQQIGPEKISHLMQQFDDIQHIFMFLDNLKRIEIYNHNKEKIQELTNTITDTKQLFDLFEPEQRHDVFEDLKAKIPGQIKTLDDLLTCFSCLEIEQCQDIYPHLPINRLIKKAENVNYLVNQADEKTLSHICVLLRDQISTMISDSNLNAFNENKRRQIHACLHGLTINPKTPTTPEEQSVSGEEKEEEQEEAEDQPLNTAPLHSNQNVRFIYYKKLLIFLAIASAIAIALIITASILLSLNVALPYIYCYLFMIVGAAAIIANIVGLCIIANKPKTPHSTADNPNRLMTLDRKNPRNTGYSRDSTKKNNNDDNSEFYGGPLESLLCLEY